MTRCSGPCLDHCYCSPLVAGLAYLAIAYLGASVLYLLMTNIMQFGTPFKDSLTAEQRRIMACSKKRRAAAFAAGILITGVTLLLLRPLRRR